MVRGIVWFALGVITTTIVFLRWDPVTRGDSSSASDDVGTAVSIRTDSGTISRVDERAAPRAESPRESTTELSEQPSESPFGSNAAPTDRIPEALRQMAERSFAFLGDNKHRHNVFAGEERDTEGAAVSLENAILNRIWQVTGNTYPPVSVDAECRSSGCRVVLTYPTLREAATADMSGVLTSELLSDLELHGFGALETRLGHDGEGQIESVLQGPNINIFFWRRSESDPQSIAGDASG